MYKMYLTEINKLFLSRMNFQFKVSISIQFMYYIILFNKTFHLRNSCRIEKKKKMEQNKNLFEIDKLKR